MMELNTHRNCGACFYLIGTSANRNGGARQRFGHMTATPAAVAAWLLPPWRLYNHGVLLAGATDAFRVLARSTQVFRLFLAQNKNGSLARTILLIIGAQKRTRTSTVLQPLGPEPSASTNSAIWALLRGCAL